MILSFYESIGISHRVMQEDRGYLLTALEEEIPTQEELYKLSDHYVSNLKKKIHSRFGESQSH